MKYDFKKIEKKWQEAWEKEELYRADDNSKKEKKYILIEFPYPSGEGLHMGHLRPYVAGDVYSRYLRMRGYEVMYPIGWDAFGLPAENYAIRNGVHPSISTARNIKNAKEQLKSWGIGFDWSREINTTDPEYYKWTQWIFLQFWKAGLAYEAEGFINWCPKDKTGLANEEVIGGCCERCGAKVEKKKLRQWYLKITAYAEKLLEGLKTLDWPEPIKIQQANWIGRSEGALLSFKATSDKRQVGEIEVFTTRPDTLFGATYMVLSPEHELISKIKNQISNWGEVEKYIKAAQGKSDEERIAEGRAKTGVELKGIKAINPATKEEIPVWVADYVLSTYGTGAIMAVPAHDKRDFEFATRYKLPVKEVVAPRTDADNRADLRGNLYEGDGVLKNSGKFTGMDSEKAKWEITKFVGGKKHIQYRLRDWVFSRQRYWGEPIPLIHCEKCALRDPSGQGVVPVPEEDLPVKLPEVKKYEPTGTGESPLAAVDSWVNVKCPQCGGPAKRETNTMPQWAGSSWYYLRYVDPHNDKEFASKKLLERWLPVDVYFGGMEHTTLHLLYSRFWHKFLYDRKLVPVPEPYVKRVPHGIILGPDGEKMSKSRGNVVSPNEIVKNFGADCLRMYELFLGPHEATVSWQSEGILGISRFLERVWKLFQASSVKSQESREAASLLHKTIKKVTEDIENFHYNTAVSALMILLNGLEKNGAGAEAKEIFLKLLAPFAPHIAEEIWMSILKKETSIHKKDWPSYDPSLIQEDTFILVVQINGKLRATLEAPFDIDEAEAEKLALNHDRIKALLGERNPRRIIYVPKKLVNIVL
jgi:leucyl-tRNA synthetase